MAKADPFQCWTSRAVQVGAVWLYLGVFVAFVVLSCSPVKATKARPSLLDGLTVAPAYASPGSWIYHPTEVGKVSYAQTLPDGTYLYLGERGERWLIEPKTKQGQVAPTFAPERLVDAVDLGTGSWLFIGEGGAIYEASDAMGPFLRVSVPPEPLVRVSVTGQAMLGISASGKLLRSPDFGSGWELLPLPGRAIDVEVLPSGQGLLLSVPEALRVTEDHGRSWAPLDVPPFGALALNAREQSIFVRASVKDREYAPGSTPVFRPASGTRQHDAVKPKLSLGPSAEAITRGHAVFTRERYFELASGERGWEFRSGKLGSPLSSRAMPLFEDCADVRVTARGEDLVVVCAFSDEAETELTLHVSGDAGGTWRQEPVRPTGTMDVLNLVLLPSRVLVLSGICQEQKDDESCKLAGIHRIPLGQSSEQKSKPAAAALAPTLHGVAFELAASPDGSGVYALGRRTKGVSLGVFVSNDEARSFRAREVAQLELTSNQSFSISGISSMTVGDDGYLSAVIRDPSSRQHVLLVLDEDGEFISLAGPPVADATIGANGLKALTVHHPSGEVFETLDGGGVWRPLGTIPVGECRQNLCDVHCSATGCVVGQGVSRLGWEGQTEQAFASPLRTTNDGTARVRSVQSTAVCRFRDDSAWSRMRTEGVPAAASAALRDTAWFAFDADFTQATVDFHTMAMSAGAQLATRPLFTSSSNAQGVAMYYTHQIEGIAAMKQVEGRGVDVAWINLFEQDSLRRFKLPSTLHVSSRVTRYPVRLGTPSELTIARGGVFFGATSDRVYFYDGGTPRRLPRHRWPPTILLGRDEMLRVGSRELALRFFSNGAGIAWTPLEAETGRVGAMTIGLPQPDDFGVSQELTIAYTGDKPGLHVKRQSEQEGTAQVLPLLDADLILGRPVSVPTQSDLPSVPPPCNPRQRATTPRLIAPYEAGTRHAVVISDPTEPLPTLVTGTAVLHGKVDDACAVAFDAASVTATGGDAAFALVFANPALPSWVFRKPPDGGDDDEFEFRELSCVFDPSAEVPAEVYTARGTQR